MDVCSHAQGYIRRAEALKKLGEHLSEPAASREKVSRNRSVVQDYCRSNLFDPNPKIFAEAVVCAVDFSKSILQMSCGVCSTCN